MNTLTEQRESTLRPGAEQTPTSEPRGPGRGVLIGLVAVLTAAVIGLAAWMIVDRTSTSDTAVTDEIEQLLDDYLEAWNTFDGDAYLALVTEDAEFVVDDAAVAASEQAANLEEARTVDWHVAQVGEPIMTGDGPWYVAQANLLTAKVYPDEGLPGISTYTIVDVDGTLLIARHVYTGQY